MGVNLLAAGCLQYAEQSIAFGHNGSVSVLVKWGSVRSSAETGVTVLAGSDHHHPKDFVSSDDRLPADAEELVSSSPNQRCPPQQPCDRDKTRRPRHHCAERKCLKNTHLRASFPLSLPSCSLAGPVPKINLCKIDHLIKVVADASRARFSLCPC
jgi:hypothetical protein